MATPIRPKDEDVDVEQLWDDIFSHVSKINPGKIQILMHV